jgi:Cytochrome c3/Cytochrome c7 and related cytochrome c
MRSGRLAVLFALSGILGYTPGPAAHAATLEGLLMPGPLSGAHAKLEADCANCHNRTDRAQQAQLCSDCHKDVATQLRERRGFHGRRPEIVGAQCSACHSEHMGRAGRITPVLPATFDHTTTDFKLDGAHRSVACSGCHTAGKKFSEAATRCVDCHRKVEPHEGKLGTDCAACHDTARWSATRFDHAKTKFPLQDRHAKIPCAACHAANRWKATPTACASCHTPDDVHRGQRGTACSDCHTQASWTDAKFDHEKETGFALVGAHRQAACQSCHRSGRLEDDLPRECSGCHAAADSHAGRMGGKCESCHETTEWKTTHFDHAKDTKYTLTGAHSTLACHSCHTAVVADHKPAQQCVTCHRAVDVHAGSLGTTCDSCHETSAWKKDIRFDHDLTAFPLIGQHVTVPCARCHATQQFKEAPEKCGGCHGADDVHKGNLGADCQRCHSPNAWNVWEFDHLKESGFALSGAHARLQCNTCHKRPAGEAKLGRDCMSCHSTDDVHLGQYGRRCDSCHSTISFRRAKPQ